MVTDVMILNSRVKRQLNQQKLLNGLTGCLISLTMNIPGTDKTSPDIAEVHLHSLNAIESLCNKQGYKVLYKEVHNHKTGPEGFICLENEGQMIKKMLIEYEEKNEVGRLLDIDVIDSFQGLISRKRFNLPSRKCFLCDENANVCRRNGTHSIIELQEFITDKMEGYLNTIHENH
jgi:holo-ACP synthase